MRIAFIASDTPEPRKKAETKKQALHRMGIEAIAADRIRAKIKAEKMFSELDKEIAELEASLIEKQKLLNPSKWKN